MASRVNPSALPRPAPAASLGSDLGSATSSASRHGGCGERLGKEVLGRRHSVGLEAAARHPGEQVSKQRGGRFPDRPRASVVGGRAP